MKKIIYLLMIVGLVFNSACDPMDEIYDELDDEQVIIGSTVLQLTDDDYKELGVVNGFTSVEEAKQLIPPFLSNLYPVWGKDSSVLVEYKMADGLSSLEEVNEYANAQTYNLVNADYPSAADNAVGFYPNQNPANYIPAILNTKIANPVEGQITLATYKQYEGEVTFGISNYYEADFLTANTLLNFETVNKLGAQVWAETNGYGAKMAGYAGGAQPNEDWLISPQVDLTNQSNPLFQVNQALNYASGQLNLINILVSTNYTTGGDPTAATWDVITLTNTPPGTNWTFVLSDEYDFSAYQGKKIHVAFKYESTSSVAATWEIAKAVIKVPGVEGTTDSKGMYFIYNSAGKWVAAQGVYYLSTSDYDSMGTASGQPGRYNNFDSKIIPNNYIPSFLSLKDPYAQEEDLLIVMYKYYIGTTVVRGNAYMVTNGVWTGSTPNLQFGNDGNTWIPDNTIKYVLTTADYDSLGTAYGSPGYYDNFDVRVGTPNYESPEEILAYINTILLNNFPGAAEGQRYQVFYNVYSGAAEVWNMKVVKQGSGYVLQ
jgi:hypothetical protein